MVVKRSRSAAGRRAGPLRAGLRPRWRGVRRRPSPGPAFPFTVTGSSGSSLTPGTPSPRAWLLRDGFFYEGTGRYGDSSLMKIEPATGQVLMRRDLDPRFFGEGIAIMGDEVFQLTWENNTGFVYGLDDFAPERTFTYETEGWGLTTDGESLIMSDGSAVLRFLDPETLEPERSVTVSDFAGPVGPLERAGIRRRGNLRQHLEAGLHSPHIARGRAGDGVDRPDRPQPPSGKDGRIRPQRHRLRTRTAATWW